MNERNYYCIKIDDQLIFWFEEDGARISFGEIPGNRHYEEYLLWLADGNTPEIINEVE